MLRRQTKRGDELREVVLLKIIQRSKVRVLIPLRECCQGYSRSCRFIVKTAPGQLPKESFGKEFNIKILQNLTVVNRSLSARIGNEFSVPKGVVWSISQRYQSRALARGEVYSLPE